MTAEAAGPRITVNGAPRTVAAGTGVRELLQALDMNPDEVRGVAVAVNDEVIPRREWAGQTFGPGDRVEIVTAKQGG